MYKYEVSIGGNNLISVSVYASAYSSGCIAITLSPNTNIDKADLIGHFPKAKREQLLVIHGDRLICNDICYIREVIENLCTLELIPENKHFEAYALCRQVEEILSQRSKNKLESSEAQKEVILSVASIYLDDIIDACNSYSQAGVLLKCAFSPKFNSLTATIKTFLTENEIKSDVFESIEALWKINHGVANLESTFLRLNAQLLPDLLAQRNVIYNETIKLLYEKFSGLDDKQQLFMVLGILLFKAEGQQLSPLGDTNSIIEEALKGDEYNPETRAVFECGQGRPGLLPLTTQAFCKMGVLGGPQPNIERISVLQSQFNSPGLLTYLNGLKKSKVTSQDLLYTGLNENNFEKVKSALATNKYDINHFFPCGRTPLIMAAQACSAAIVELILSYKPEVDKLNRYNYFNALAVVVSGKVDHEKLLRILEAGASVFVPCGIRAVKTDSKAFAPGRRPECVIESSMGLALGLYDENPTEDNKKAVSLLLEYGAGIGHAFDERHYSLLAGKVLLGGNITGKNLPNDVIVSVGDFLQKIPAEKFPFWIKQLNKASSFYQARGQVDLVFILEGTLHAIARKMDPRHDANPEQPDASGISPKQVIVNSTTSALAASLSNAFGTTVIAPAEKAHREIVTTVKPIIDRTGDKFAAFFRALENKTYARALRIAATSTAPEALQFTKLLCKYQSVLDININERAGENNYAPIHYAAKNANQDLYDYLVSVGADPQLKDKHGISAEEHLNKSCTEKMRSASPT